MKLLNGQLSDKQNVLLAKNDLPGKVFVIIRPSLTVAKKNTFLSKSFLTGRQTDRQVES